MERKEPIRRQILALRERMPKEERRRKSADIMEKLFQAQWYLEAGIVLAYVSFRSEVDTGELIRKALLDGKKVYCPKVEGEWMNFYRILSPDELEEGYAGIREPSVKAGRLFSADDALFGRCLMAMPGSVFDRKCHRMGYGKGYYDKYLDFLFEENDDFAFQFKTIGLCFECQMKERIPVDVYDKKADMVITEKKIYQDRVGKGD